MDPIQAYVTITFSLFVLFWLYKEGILGRLNHLDIGVLGFRDAVLFLVCLAALGLIVKAVTELLQI